MCAEENPILEKAVNKLLYVSADEKLRYELDMREKAELDYRSAMRTNYDRGREEEREIAKKDAEEKEISAVKKLLGMGIKEADIAEALDMPIEKVKKIKV